MASKPLVSKAGASKAITPVGLNHLVINVRNLEESHRFWTEIIGFKQVAELHATPKRPNPPKMRFYSGDHGGGRMSHHDLALMEMPNLPAPPSTGTPAAQPSPIGHIAITLPGREAWLAQLEHLQASGVMFDRRIEHGMTHSVYIHDPNGYSIELLYDLPREVWEGDIEAAQNYSVQLPTEGAEALQDRTEDLPVFKARETTGA